MLIYLRRRFTWGKSKSFQLSNFLFDFQFILQTFVFLKVINWRESLTVCWFFTFGLNQKQHWKISLFRKPDLMFVSSVDVMEEVLLTASPVGFLQTDSMWTSVWDVSGRAAAHSRCCDCRSETTSYQRLILFLSSLLILLVWGWWEDFCCRSQ